MTEKQRILMLSKELREKDPKKAIDWAENNGYQQFVVPCRVEEYLVLRFIEYVDGAFRDTTHYIIARDGNTRVIGFGRKYLWGRYTYDWNLFTKWDYRKPIDYRGGWYMDFIYTCEHPYNYNLYRRTICRDKQFRWILDASKDYTAVTLAGFARQLGGLAFAESHYKMGTLGLIKKIGLEDMRLYWASIKIANRHGYIPESWSTWIKYLRLLEENGKDIRNPKNICVPDVCNLYSRLSMADSDRKFFEHREPYLGILISNEKFNVHILNSIADYEAEGEEMSHCVGKNNYALKYSSICMSVRIGNKRIETVELGLSTFKVLQAYGKGDRKTKYHDEIIKLIEDNAWRFKEIKDKINKTA